jgi:hypothetical protein
MNESPAASDEDGDIHPLHASEENSVALTPLANYTD